MKHALPSALATAGLLALAALPAYPAQQRLAPDALDALLATQELATPSASEGAAPRLGFEQAGGPLRYLGAAPGHHFRTAVQGPPEDVARAFLRTNGPVFGIESPYVGFETLRTRTSAGRQHVRLQQTYQGVPVYAAQASVQLDAQGGVECVLADLLRDTSDLDLGRLSVDPALPEDLAVATARALYPAELRDGLELVPGRLWIYAPDVLGIPGRVRLVWELRVQSPDGFAVAEDVLLDALSGEFAARFPLRRASEHRDIFDANNTAFIPPLPRRTEGQAPVGVAEVDDAYDFLGDAYDYFSSKHGRDGYDGAGSPLIATARWCQPNPPTPQDPFPPPTCPPPGLAYWLSATQSMFVGDGYAKDDVIAHELTHGVTEHESNLVYANASGALNESFSDLWGESIDLAFHHGDDGAAVRWEIGEDMPGGYIRNMSDPTLRGDPDRYGSPLFQAFTFAPDDGNDNGGVHTNSGINNKLFFLLSDGATFNGYTVDGLGEGDVVDLYYEVNTNLLLSGADFRDLYFALKQAAVNIGWNGTRRANLERACLAVEIGGIFARPDAGCANMNGTRRCALGAEQGPYRLMASAVSAASSGDTIIAMSGDYHEFNLVVNKEVRIVADGGPATLGR